MELIMENNFRKLMDKIEELSEAGVGTGELKSDKKTQLEDTNLILHSELVDAFKKEGFKIKLDSSIPDNVVKSRRVYLSSSFMASASAGKFEDQEQDFFGHKFKSEVNTIYYSGMAIKLLVGFDEKLKMIESSVEITDIKNSIKQKKEPVDTGSEQIFLHSLEIIQSLRYTEVGNNSVQTSANFMKTVPPKIRKAKGAK